LRNIVVLMGACLAAIGCGTPGAGASSGTGGAATGSGVGAATGTGGGSTTGTGGASCGVTEIPIDLHPWTPLSCNPFTMTSLGHPFEIARVPGWKHPILVDQATILAARNALDGECSLESNYSVLVAVAGDAPPVPAAAWSEVSFNPQIVPSANDPNLSEVVIDLPPQLVNAGQNLFIAMKTQGDNGRFCFGLCDNQSDWMWAGDDLGGLVARTYQGRLFASGKVQRACEAALHNNREDCAAVDLSSLTAGPNEDGDLVVERLVATSDLSVKEIVFEMSDNPPCALPAEVELLYFVGDPTAPEGSAWTEAKVPGSGAFRVGELFSVLSLPVDPPLLVPSGKALYAGIRQHPGTTCMATCAGPKAADGDAWWGHTHTTPGAVEWASLASEGFIRSLRLSAIYATK
jgi:hypothetical protein